MKYYYICHLFSVIIINTCIFLVRCFVYYNFYKYLHIVSDMLKNGGVLDTLRKDVIQISSYQTKLVCDKDEII